VSTEIGTGVTGGQVESVSVTMPRAGRYRVPCARTRHPGYRRDPLNYGARYQATVTAIDAHGQHASATTSFGTMADPGGDRIGTGLYFFTARPTASGCDRGGVRRADPGQCQGVRRAAAVREVHAGAAGGLALYGDRQVLYRPKQYWLPGTSLTVRAALGGLQVGRRFVDQDRGRYRDDRREAGLPGRQRGQADGGVYQDDKLVRTFPVSLGKPSTPSSSGNLVIMTRDYQTIFDVPGEYRVNIFYAERITWGGQYIHAAPWSVGDQGHDNVSHGCVNLSDPNASWSTTAATSAIR